MGMEYRPLYLAKEWKNAGHEVTILAASFAHVRTSQPKVEKDFQEEIIHGVKYVWLKVPSYEGNGIGRIKNIFSFTNKLRKYAKKVAQRYQPDAIIASSTYPLDNIYAHKIAKYSGGKYLYEIHDLWPLSPMELGGYSKLHPFIFIMQYVENFAYKNCHAVVSMLPKTQEHTKAHGLNPQKWNYIPNGINIKEWEKTQELNSKVKSRIESIKARFDYLVGYTGAHGPANALKTLIRAANQPQNQSIAFVLVGKGPEKGELIAMCQEAKAENVFFIDNIDKKEIPTLLSFFNFLYIGLKHEPLFRFGISPNKLIDYMMAAKPIIFSIEAGNNPVKESNCGISIAPENPDEISRAISKLSIHSANELIKMGQRGNKFVRQNHDYKVLAANFIKVIEEC